MECCENRSIRSINYERVCTNCGVIHDYEYVHPFRDNIPFYRKSVYKRKKYLYNKCFHIRQINNNIILFFDKSLEEIKNLYNLQRISITKYLNSLYNFYCNKSSIEYKPIFENKKIINLNENIIKILEKNYLLFPHIIKNEDDYIYLE